MFLEDFLILTSDLFTIAEGESVTLGCTTDGEVAGASPTLAAGTATPEFASGAGCICPSVSVAHEAPAL